MGWRQGVFLRVEFSRPFDEAGLASDQKAVAGKMARGKNLQAHFDFKTQNGEKLLTRVALSTVSVEGARRNLRAEVTTWDFDTIAMAARAQWEQALSTIRVQSANTNFLETFYSAFYHVFLAPTILMTWTVRSAARTPTCIRSQTSITIRSYHCGTRSAPSIHC